MGSYQKACPKHWQCCVSYLFFVLAACLWQRTGNAGLRAFGPPVEEG